MPEVSQGFWTANTCVVNARFFWERRRNLVAVGDFTAPSVYTPFQEIVREFHKGAASCLTDYGLCVLPTA
jgi:hypothetical protein